MFLVFTIPVPISTKLPSYSLLYTDKVIPSTNVGFSDSTTQKYIELLEYTISPSGVNASLTEVPSNGDKTVDVLLYVPVAASKLT